MDDFNSVVGGWVRGDSNLGALIISSDDSYLMSLPPIKSYMVLHSGRCGSTFLHHHSIARGLFPAYEIFCDDSFSYMASAEKTLSPRPAGDYIISVVEHLLAPQNKVGDFYSFGVGVTPSQLYQMGEFIEVDKFIARFSQYGLIVLTRKNILRQAISYAIAEKSKIYHIKSSGEGARAHAGMSFGGDIGELVFRYVDLILWQESIIPGFVSRSGVVARAINYEYLIESPEVVVLEQFSALRGDIPFNSTSSAQSGVEKIALGVSDELYESLITDLFSRDFTLPSGRIFSWSEFVGRFYN